MTDLDQAAITTDPAGFARRVQAIGRSLTCQSILGLTLNGDTARAAARLAELDDTVLDELCTALDTLDELLQAEHDHRHGEGGGTP